MTSKITNTHSNQQPAGFPPAPSEAHQRAAGGDRGDHLNTTSIGTVVTGFNALWAARERRNAIDKRIAILANASNGNDKARGKLAALTFERVEVVQRIAALSSNAVGLANATARRLA